MQNYETKIKEANELIKKKRMIEERLQELFEGKKAPDVKTPRKKRQHGVASFIRKNESAIISALVKNRELTTLEVANVLRAIARGSDDESMARRITMSSIYFFLYHKEKAGELEKHNREGKRMAVWSIPATVCEHDFRYAGYGQPRVCGSCKLSEPEKMRV